MRNLPGRGDLCTMRWRNWTVFMTSTKEITNLPMVTGIGFALVRRPVTEILFSLWAPSGNRISAQNGLRELL